MPTDFSFLPDEVLAYIFQCLDVRRRLNASLVCKKWFNVINSSLLLEDVKFRIFNRNIATFFNSFSRQYCCLCLDNILIDDQLLKVLKERSEQFHSLYFIDCQMNEKNSNLQRKVLKCDNLQFLQVRNCEAFVLFDLLPNLTSLEIFHFSLTDYELHQLDKTMPKLKKLTLTSRISCDRRAYKRFYVDENSIENKPSSDILSFPAVKNFIAKRSGTITDLDLLKTGLYPAASLEISRIKNLNLKSLPCLPYLEEEELRKICENQPFLTSVSIRCKRNLSEETISVICHELSNLRELSLIYCHTSENSVIEIFHLKHLRKLDLAHCCHISPSSFSLAVRYANMTHLEHLNLSFTKMDDNTLQELLSHNTGIQHLDLSSTDISNSTLNMLCKTHTHLKYLILSECSRISDSGLTGEFKCEPTSLSDLVYLRKLDLSKNPSITIAGCLKVIHFQHLEVLNLRECPNLLCLDESNADFHVILKQNPSLGELNLPGNSFSIDCAYLRS